jgi:cytidylate kinase
MKDRKRIDDCIKYGIIDTLIVTLILTAIFEIFARPIANLFGLTGGTTLEIIDICKIALRIASIGYIFMGFSVAVQGVLQSIGYAIRPLVISLLRLVIFVFPIAYFFTLSDNVTNIVWWTFPIAEILTAIVSIFILRKSYKERIENIKETELSKVSKGNRNLVISISREHGTNGKEIAKKVAENLRLKFYDKEEMKKYAISHSFESNNHSDDELYKFYLSLDAEKDSIIKQSEIIKSIATEDNCVIVGRASDYILKDNTNLIKIFLYAPLEYRINKVKEIYKDTYQEAKKHVIESDKSRASYYEVISNQSWGDKENYDLCLNCEIGNDAIVKIICDYIKNRN